MGENAYLEDASSEKLVKLSNALEESSSYQINHTIQCNLDTYFQQPNANKGPTRILLVDDEAFNIEALKIILKFHCNIDSDKICDVAWNGEEALQAVKDNVA